MNELPAQIKQVYIMAIVVMMLFVAFIILVVLMYNRKQLLYLKEQQLKESEHQNQLLQKELEQQKSIEKERERISHDMHDDLGAGISALKLQAEFLKYKIEDNELQSDIDELLKTSEEMNISMREMLWSLNSGNDTLGSFVDYAILYAGSFLKKTKVVLHPECGNIISQTPMSTEMRRNLFLCLKEAINNVYKHSQANTLKLSFSQNENQFLITIEDNGIGIPDSQSGGNGLRNMKRRMIEVEGECKILSTSSGTKLTFEVTL
ncbi:MULTISPECIES: sensor histidine kinase [unclassified Chryseobacterium]|uniref:sensor histidine kinase n=1 Tax=unclassified Chryseobacterium TaxID=2593645 RepID=UPI00100A5838|nr:MULTISPECIES: histidine kinase [unclassified Chryseobacterium]RXM51902.1 two-component sensor histidine kinase [Chryseobacterium sp. CH25]RXM63822.1 two-component sensor histidine kinase [Chryseobacterium sp. CH1]